MGGEEKKGIKVKQAKGAVIDATIIESAARPKKQLEEISEDRKEIDKINNYVLKESCDPDARWLKKGKRSYYGYKMFLSTQEDDGFIEGISITPANQSEVTYFPKILQIFFIMSKDLYVLGYYQD